MNGIQTLNSSPCPSSACPRVSRDESGFALIMTIFIIALATILVLDFAAETLAYQSNSRASTERIQADYALKSTINFARVLLEVPKLPNPITGEPVREDWLGEPWAMVASVPSLAFIPGGPRLTITDEGSKININSILATDAPPPPIGAPTPQPTPGSGGQPGGDDTNSSFWKNALSELFSRLGFDRTVYESDSRRTLGSVGYAAPDQVAVIHDWADADNDSHSSGKFPGEGIESFADKMWFYNRPMRSLSELALVPGMTLERVQIAAPFVRVGRSNVAQSFKVNVNTAPIEVLLALGFEEAETVKLEGLRADGPISSDNLREYVTGNQQLAQATGVTSQEYSAYAQIRMSNTTRWAKALIQVDGGGQNRRTRVLLLELN